MWVGVCVCVCVLGGGAEMRCRENIVSLLTNCDNYVQANYLINRGKGQKGFGVRGSGLFPIFSLVTALVDTHQIKLKTINGCRNKLSRERVILYVAIKKKDDCMSVKHKVVIQR